MKDKKLFEILSYICKLRRFKDNPDAEERFLWLCKHWDGTKIEKLCNMENCPIIKEIKGEENDNIRKD